MSRSQSQANLDIVHDLWKPLERKLRHFGRAGREERMHRDFLLFINLFERGASGWPFGACYGVLIPN